MARWLACILFLIYLNAPVVCARELGLPTVLAGFALLALAVPVYRRLVELKEPVYVPPALAMAALFAVLGFVSAAGSARPQSSIAYALSFTLEGFAVAFLIANAIRTRDELTLAVKALVAAGGLMGLIALLHQIIGTEQTAFFGFSQLDATISDDAGHTRRRMAGPLGETNRFAQVLAVLLPLSGAMIRHGRPGARLFFAGCTACIAVGVVLTFSRGAVVALILSMPFALALGVIGRRHLFVLIVIGAVTVAALPPLAERIQSVGAVLVQTTGFGVTGLRAADGAARGRVTEMQATGLMFLERPLIGNGPGMVPYLYPEYAVAVGGKVRPERRQAHNLYLEVAAETGLLGFACYALCLGLTLAGVLSLRREARGGDPYLSDVASALALALIISLLTSLFLHSSFIRYFWLLVGVCLGAARVRPRPALAWLLDGMFAQVARQLRTNRLTS